MGLPLQKPTIDDFLAWEDLQAERHEYWRGDIFGMTGAALRHNRVILNLATALTSHLDGTGCQLFTESAKLRIADDGIFYPDLMVTCSLGDLADEKHVVDPVLIVEVLSPSTEGYDRRNKFVVYRSIPSLRTFVLIEPETRTVEVFTLSANGEWALSDQTRRGALTLSMLDLVIGFDCLFKGLAPPASRAPAAS